MPLVSLTTSAHRDLVHQLRDESERWLASKGLDQFQPGTPSRAHLAHGEIDRAFDACQFHGLDRGGELVAVAALTDPDPDFWTESERAESQGYVARLMVTKHGRGHGRAMIGALVDHEHAAGKRWLRLDCWRTNTALHLYYQLAGFHHLRTDVVPGRMTGALFQRDLFYVGSVPTRWDTDDVPPI